MAIKGTSIIETHVQTTIGRIANSDEWNQFRTYYFRYHAKNKEHIYRGCEESMPLDVSLLTEQAPTKRRIDLMKEVIHAFHSGYESCIADRT